MINDFKYVLESTGFTNLELPTSPINWESLTLNIKRSADLLGIVKSFSTDAEFYGVGREYILNVFDAKGVNGEIKVTISVLDRTDYDYKTLLVGRINLNNVTQRVDENNVITLQTNIEETGFERDFIDNIGNKVDLFELFTKQSKPITPTGQESQSLTLKGMPISKFFIADLQAAPQVVEAPWLYGAKYDSKERWYYYFVMPTDNTIRKTLEDSFTYTPSIYQESPINNSLYAVNCKEDGSYRIQVSGKLRFKMNVPKSSEYVKNYSARLGVYILKSGESLPSLWLIDEIPSTDRPKQDSLVTPYLDGSFDRTFNLDAGDKIYIYADMDVKYETEGVFNGKAAIDNFEVDVENSSIDIKAKTTVIATTNIDTKRVDLAFERLINWSTGLPNKFKSTLLADKDYLITTGYFIRGLSYNPVENKNKKLLSISFKDLYDTINYIHGIGVGVINDEIVLEKADFFYTTDVALTIDDNLSEFTETVIETDYITQVSIGFNKWETDSESVTGALEYNGKRIYSTDVRNTENTLQIHSPLVGAGYSIEVTRRKRIVDIESADNTKYDEEVFIISAKKQVPTDPDDTAIYENLTNEDISIEQGLDEIKNDAYNLAFTPARAFRNHLPKIASGLFKIGNLIRLNATEGYDEFITRKGTESSIDESSSVSIDSTVIPYTAPRLFNFTAPLTYSDLVVLQSKIYGLIEFTNPITNQVEQAYIENIEYDFETRTANFELKAKGKAIIQEAAPTITNVVIGTQVYSSCILTSELTLTFTGQPPLEYRINNQPWQAFNSGTGEIQVTNRTGFTIQLKDQFGQESLPYTITEAEILLNSGIVKPTLTISQTGTAISACETVYELTIDAVTGSPSSLFYRPIGGAAIEVTENTAGNPINIQVGEKFYVGPFINLGSQDIEVYVADSCLNSSDKQPLTINVTAPPPLTITSVTPVNGSAEGEYQVTIIGDNGADMVRVGASPTTGGFSGLNGTSPYNFDLLSNATQAYFTLYACGNQGTTFGPVALPPFIPSDDPDLPIFCTLVEEIPATSCDAAQIIADSDRLIWHDMTPLLVQDGILLFDDNQGTPAADGPSNTANKYVIRDIAGDPLVKFTIQNNAITNAENC